MMIRKLMNLTKKLLPGAREQETSSIWRLLYEMVHDLDDSLGFSARQTERAFAKQWHELPQGQALLSDAWFRENVDRILWEEEIQIRRDWFKDKWVLDAGCGNGRWSYGLARLGANVTAVDVNQSAIDATKDALKEFDVVKEFHASRLEDLLGILSSRKYDLAFCWGVLHHSRSFNRALDTLCNLVSEHGILYLYIYGRESLNYDDDVELFKKRVYYNTLPDEKSKHAFLLKASRNDPSKIHAVHDLYAPLVNRRLEFDYVKGFLQARGFGDVARTIDDSELFVRAIRTNSVQHYYENWILPKKKPPYWFYRYR